MPYSRCCSPLPSINVRRRRRHGKRSSRWAQGAITVILCWSRIPIPVAAPAAWVAVRRDRSVQAWRKRCGRSETPRLACRPGGLPSHCRRLRRRAESVEPSSFRSSQFVLTFGSDPGAGTPCQSRRVRCGVRRCGGRGLPARRRPRSEPRLQRYIWRPGHQCRGTRGGDPSRPQRLRW
jgi:hypothetical protein